MSERMNDALMDLIHEAIHASLAASLVSAVEASPGSRVATLSMEQVLGPLALGMFHQGIMFALRNAAAARAYDEMLSRGMSLDETDRQSIAADLRTLEAAWRPLQ